MFSEINSLIQRRLLTDDARFYPYNVFEIDVKLILVFVYLRTICDQCELNVSNSPPCFFSGFPYYTYCVRTEPRAFFLIWMFIRALFCPQIRFYTNNWDPEYRKYFTGNHVLIKVE